MAIARWIVPGFLALGMLGVAVARTQQTPPAATPGPLPCFEVASIRPSRPESRNVDWDDSPGRVSITGYSLRRLIRAAYGLKSNAQVLGGPKWIESARFDIVAKADDAETAKMQKMSDADWVKARSLMLQLLLADRFQLKVIQDTRVLPVYALVVVKSGIKFKPAKSGEDGDLSGWGGHLEATGTTMDAFADYLNGVRELADRVILNRTSLTAAYDFNLDWSRDHGDGGSQDSEFPGLYTALEEQLGLKLEPEKAATEVVIVESASEPALE
jgi:bla regulator protein BlaR1